MHQRIQRPAHLVQLLISLANGAITLVLLLIAPLGLASVITLTLLITASTYVCGTAGRVLERWLQGSTDRTAAAHADRAAATPQLPAGRWRLPKR